MDILRKLNAIQANLLLDVGSLSLRCRFTSEMLKETADRLETEALPAMSAASLKWTQDLPFIRLSLTHKDKQFLLIDGDFPHVRTFFHIVEQLDNNDSASPLTLHKHPMLARRLRRHMGNIGDLPPQKLPASHALRSDAASIHSALDRSILPDGQLQDSTGDRFPKTTSADCLLRLETLVSLTPLTLGVSLWMLDDKDSIISWYSKGGKISKVDEGCMSPLAILSLLSSTAIVLLRTGEHASLLLGKDAHTSSGALLQAINTMLSQVRAILLEGTADAEEPSNSLSPPSPASGISGDDVSTDSNTKKQRGDVNLSSLASPPPPGASQVVLRGDSLLDRALIRLSTRPLVAGFLIVSGVPLSMSAKILFENMEDILAHYGVPLHTAHLKEALGIHPVKPWDGKTDLSNILLTPTLDLGVREDAVDDSGSLALKLRYDCTFGDMVDPANLRFLRTFSAYGASFRCGDRKFQPLFHFNPVLEDDIAAVLDDNSALFMVRGGTGVDATDSFLAARVSSISEVLLTGPISVHVEGVRRVHKVYGFTRDGRTSIPLTRFCTEMVFTVRLLSSPFGRQREDLYDKIRRMCAQRTRGWTAEEDKGILETCPALWMLPDELVFEIYAAHYTRYLDIYRTHFSYPHIVRGAPRSVSLVAIRSTEYIPVSLADFLAALQEFQVDLGSILCIYPFPPLRHTEPPFVQDRPYSLDFPQQRMVIVWASNIGRSLPARITLPSGVTAGLLVTAEPTQHLPGFWNAGEQPTAKLYLNGFLRKYYLQYQDSNPSARQGLAPVGRFLDYVNGPAMSTSRSTKRGAGTLLPSPALTAPNSTPPSMATRMRPAPITSSRAVVPSPPTSSHTSTAVAVPGAALDLGALISSLESLSSHVSEVRDLQLAQMKRIEDLERNAKK
jgi:hypothetical protein